MDLIRKSVEQMRAEALKRTTEKKEEENRKNMFLEQETRRQNQANAFAMHIQKVKNNEDVIAKSVLNVKQAEDEYETMLSANGISNSNDLKEKMRKILGEEKEKFWHDYKGAGINSIRTKNMIEKSDIVIVKFGEKYRQWNAAFDAGMAVTLGKSLITLHEENLDHALKEIDAASSAVCRTEEQVIETLQYVING